MADRLQQRDEEMIREMSQRLAAHYSELFTDEVVFTELTQVIEDVMSGKWPDDTPVSHGLTIADLKPIAGWYTSPELMGYFFAALTGRNLRAYMINTMQLTTADELASASVPLLLALNDPTDAQQDRLMDSVISLCKTQYGDVTADPVRVQQLLSKEQIALVAGMRRAGLNDFADNLQNDLQDKDTQ